MSMDRRRFFKLSAIAAAVSALPRWVSAADKRNCTGGTDDTAVSGTIPVPPCRVTVLRKECYMDIQSLYLDDPEAGACDTMECGATFTSPDGSCPAGFCPKAWESIRATLADPKACHGRNSAAATAIASCPDGTRPVIFKIEIHNS